ncbi:MAG: hypothetical protein LC729_04090 [Acidobacteria bacterium]|nr:hypothetical protein [Acidobacteriota bacterium]
MPAGTDYFLGVVLVTMLTGHLAQSKGSLARAVFPFVSHLRWGWHACERVLERGRISMDELFDRSYAWCVTELAAEVVCLGPMQREVQAVDSSTIARFRALKRLEAAGKGYWGRAGKAVRANIVAAVTSVVLIGGIRCGLVRRTRFGESPEAAVAHLWTALPACTGKRLIVVDAGIATKEQFTLATEAEALMGRLRINVKLRMTPPRRTGRRGRPVKHGAVLHPGTDEPEVEPAEVLEIEAQDEKGKHRLIRLRRWREAHYEEYAETVFDVVRVDDPKYEKPLLLGSTARELSTTEFLEGYRMRMAIETNFYVGQDSCAMEMPRAFTENGVTRRISLALLAGTLLKAIAARCDPIAVGPWDRKPQRTGGRLAHFLSHHAANFAAIALAGVAARNYRKNQNAKVSKNSQLKSAA